MGNKSEDDDKSEDNDLKHFIEMVPTTKEEFEKGFPKVLEGFIEDPNGWTLQSDKTWSYKTDELIITGILDKTKFSF